MDASSIDILSLIPQRPPFVFVSRLLTADEAHGVTSFTIPADCPLLSGKRLTTAGLLENMAQTCAARIGYLQVAQQQPVRIGFIGSVHPLQVYAWPQVGDTLTTEAVLTQSVFDISLFRCTTRLGDTLLAEGNLKLALV